jgi:hypothetical protein
MTLLQTIFLSYPVSVLILHFYLYINRYLKLITNNQAFIFCISFIPFTNTFLVVLTPLFVLADYLSNFSYPRLTKYYKFLTKENL